MSNAVWKLTTLAGIVGIGLLVVMNAQRELRDKDNDETTSPVAALGEKGDASTSSPPDGNTEPAFGPEEFQDDDPVPAAKKTSKSLDPAASDDRRLPPEEDGPKLADNRRRPSRLLADDPAELAPVPLPEKTGSRKSPTLAEELAETEAPGQTESADVPSDSIVDRPGDAALPALPTEDERPLPPAEKASGRNPFDDPAPSRLPQGDAEPSDTEPASSTLTDDDFPSGRTKGSDVPDQPREIPAERPSPEPEPARHDDLQPLAPRLGSDERPRDPVPSERSSVRDDEDDDSSFGSRTESPSRTPAPEPREELSPAASAPDEAAPLPAESDAPPTGLMEDDEGNLDRDRDRGAPTPASLREPPPALPDEEDADSTAEPRRASPPRDEPAASADPAPRINEDDDFLTGPRSGEGARVDVSKSAPQTATIGEPMTYQILVRNSGSARAAQVIVEDRLPRGVDLDRTEPRADLLDSRLVWRLGALDAGEQRKISVTVVPRTEGKIGTVAMVRFASSNGSETLVAAPRLKFELLGPPQAALGSAVTFRFRVTNTGTLEARKVHIQSKLPPELSHPDGEVLSCDIGSLAPGKSDEVPLQLTAARQGPAAYRAVVTAEGGVSLESEARLEIISASFKLTRTGPKRMYLGRSGTFVNEVVNKDERPVTNMTIVEKIPAGLKFVQATGGGRFDPEKREVTWQLRRIEPGEKASVDVVLTLLDRGAQTTTVRAFDRTAMAVVDFTTNGAGVSALTIDMSEPETPQMVGDVFNCKVRVINRGSETAENVRLTIVLPENLELVRAQGVSNYQVQGDRVEFAPLSIESRGEVAFDLELRARGAGEARLQALVTSARMPDPLRSEETTTIVAPE